MFNFFKKDFEIISPVDGVTFDLTQFPDPVFAEKMTGDGIAIKITGDTFVAPADGQLAFIFETNHAFGMQLDNGVEILVHIGVDTVKLKGEGFTRLIEPNQHVKMGTPIMKIDRELIESKGIITSTPVLITNVDSLKSMTPVKEGTPVTAGKSAIISYKVK